MSDSPTPPEPTPLAGLDALPRLIQALVDQLTETRLVWDRVERQAMPLLERIALALERGGAAVPQGSGLADSADGGVTVEVRAAISAGHWDQAEASILALAQRSETTLQAEALTLELNRARERAVRMATERIEAAREANDATGALEARDQLALLLPLDELRGVDRGMIGWLMKLIQRRLRIIPISSDLATLVGQVADRFGGTPEGASLRAALPTLRRSAGLCPRCAEPDRGVDEACPQCLAKSGQEPTPAPTLTFVSADDDLDDIVQDRIPLDLNRVETWQLP